MNRLTADEESKLLKVINSCYSEPITDEKCQQIMDQLKRLIPFEYWGIIICYFDSELVSIEELAWFRGIEGFEEHYMNNNLFFRDPVAITAVEQMKKLKPKTQFWMDTYSNFPESDFYEEITNFPIINFNGYTCLHRINFITAMGFSVTGPNIGPKRDKKIVQLLDLIAPHIAYIAQNGKIGKLRDLTSKQYNVYRLLKLGLPNEAAAKVLNISPSGVEKHFEAIKRKTGINSKKELKFGFNKFN